MANQFIGLHMRVVLRDPPSYTITGTVRDVEAGSCLTLTNVFVTGTKQWLPQMKIHAANIADLAEVKEDVVPATYVAPVVEPIAVPAVSRPIVQPVVYPVVQPVAHPVAQPVAPPPFIDPAILSLGRRPTSGTPSASDVRSLPTGGVSPGLKVGQPDVLPALPSRTLLESQTPTKKKSLTSSINDLAVKDPALERYNGQTGESQDTQSQRKKRRARQPKQQIKIQPIEDEVPDMEGSPAHSGRGKGWRQTPILQSTSSFQPFNSLKRNGKGLKGGADNGWASEDVTEEMGDFDFENNLAKFDKRTIFDQMRKDDQVDDASRLVSHNRKPKPGTAGGKNLHHSENVLDLPPTIASRNADFWNSEADDGVNGADGLGSRDVRSSQSNRKTETKTAASRRSQSRKASTVAIAGGLPLSRVNSGVRANHPSQRPMPRPESASTNSRKQQGQAPGLYLVPSNRPLETVSALQMLNLENIAANEIGLTEEVMTENAGRGIAEVALTALSDPAIKVRFGLAGTSLSASAILSSPAVVIMAGNNKSGIRAIAAGRHLRNKNLNVMVCLVGIERERDLLDDLRQQIQLYRNFGGKILSKNELFEQLRKNSASSSPVSISLIVDALLGLTISFEELRTGDQATVYELMEWANRNEAFVLSVDVPTGIDPSSGKVAVIDGSPLFVKPRYVISLGAPKRGLLEAVTQPGDDDPLSLTNVSHEDDWRLFIADMGLGSAVWRKAGTKIRRGIDFEDKWVLEMRYRDGQDDSDEDHC